MNPEYLGRSELPEIAQLKKEVDDFRFFEELSSYDDDGNHRDGTGRNQTQRGRKITSPKDRVIELQSRLKELETELRNVKEGNLGYMDANAALVNTIKNVFRSTFDMITVIWVLVLVFYIPFELVLIGTRFLNLRR